MGPLTNTVNTAPPAGVSGYDLIYAALRELQVLRPGMTPNPETIEDGRRQINRLFDSWNTERLLIPAIVRATYNLTAGQTTYGIGGDVEGRPAKIERACILQSGSGTELPVTITDDRRRLSGNPSQRLLHCDYAFPVAEVIISPAPSGADVLVLYRWGSLTKIGDVNETLQLAPGYENAIVFNLALQMSSAFAISAKSPVLFAQIADQAMKAKAQIKRLRLPRPEMKLDTAFLGRRRRFDMSNGGLQ